LFHDGRKEASDNHEQPGKADIVILRELCHPIMQTRTYLCVLSQGSVEEEEEEGQALMMRMMDDAGSSYSVSLAFGSSGRRVEG